MTKKLFGIPRGAWLIGAIMVVTFIPDAVPKLRGKLDEALKLTLGVGAALAAFKDHKPNIKDTDDTTSEAK